MNQQKINEKILDELQFGFSCEKKIHDGWKEFERFKKQKDIPKNLTNVLRQHFGKWQYVYHSEKGTISLIRISISFPLKGKDKWTWEMYSNETLFPDVIRFRTKKEADKAIREYLCCN